MIRFKRGDEWKGEDSVLYEIQEVRMGVGDDVPRVWYWPQRTSVTHSA